VIITTTTRRNPRREEKGLVSDSFALIIRFDRILSSGLVIAINRQNEATKEASVERAQTHMPEYWAAERSPISPMGRPVAVRRAPLAFFRPVRGCCRLP